MKQIIKTISKLLAVTGIMTLVAVGAAMPSLAAPADVIDKSCEQAGNAGTDFCTGRDQNLFSQGGLFFNIINTIIFVIGAVAVVMIVIGGFRYVVSGGDSSQITGAKNTILYAIVGLVIALLSYAIVNFVINRF